MNKKPEAGDVWGLTDRGGYAEFHLLRLNENYKLEDKLTFISRTIYTTSSVWPMGSMWLHTQPEQGGWKYIRKNQNIYEELKTLLEE